MTNENFEEQQVTGLGINAFRNPEENQELETKQVVMENQKNTTTQG